MECDLANIFSLIVNQPTKVVKIHHFPQQKPLFLYNNSNIRISAPRNGLYFHKQQPLKKRCFGQQIRNKHQNHNSKNHKYHQRILSILQHYHSLTINYYNNINNHIFIENRHHFGVIYHTPKATKESPSKEERYFFVKLLAQRVLFLRKRLCS